VPFSPFLTGVLVKSAMVQPQVGFTSDKISGCAPTFVNSKIVVTGVPCGTYQNRVFLQQI
jgi:hypothetical protein